MCISHGRAANVEAGHLDHRVAEARNVALFDLGRAHDGGVDVYEGDAGLLGQAVHVLGYAVLRVAHVDDDVGVSGQQGLEVHLALAAEAGKTPQQATRLVGQLFELLVYD